MQTNINASCNIDDDESCDHNNEDKFEYEQEYVLKCTMVQNISSFEQIYDCFENVVTVAPSQYFKPMGLFKKPIVKN